jgi:hypothetical protein
MSERYAGDYPATLQWIRHEVDGEAARLELAPLDAGAGERLIIVLPTMADVGGLVAGEPASCRVAVYRRVGP